MAPSQVPNDTHDGATNGSPNNGLVGVINGISNGISNGIHKGSPNGTISGTLVDAPSGSFDGTLGDNDNGILPKRIIEGIVDVIQNHAHDVVIILGAGCFGGSTAYWLAKFGLKNVILVDNTDYPNPRAASHDINKIIRDDYPDPLYTRMLRHSMPLWRSGELLSTRYHEVGMLRADPTGFCDLSLATKEAEGIKHSSRYLTIDEVRQGWNGAFDTADLAGVEKVLYNPSAGFAEADKALGDIVQAAVDLGVKFVKGEMSTLTFGDDGSCTGVQLKDGQIIPGSKILLAAGARTAELLVQSAPENKSLHAGDRVIATGAVSFYSKVEGERQQKLKDIPVFKNCLPQVKGEGMSILPNGTIKFNCDLCFTNYITHPVTGEKMSVAPNSDDRNTWTEPPFLSYFMARARKTMIGLYGKAVDKLSILGYRMCWDASTPTHDFLITPHPHCKNLFIATGGSFHGYKFLPIIGEYVAAMMYDVLPEEYADRWAWDKKNSSEDSANPTYQVIGDLTEIIKGEIPL